MFHKHPRSNARLCEPMAVVLPLSWDPDLFVGVVGHRVPRHAFDEPEGSVVSESD